VHADAADRGMIAQSGLPAEFHTEVCMLTGFPRTHVMLPSRIAIDPDFAKNPGALNVRGWRRIPHPKIGQIPLSARNLAPR
jgi:hypothetical protein